MPAGGTIFSYANDSASHFQMKTEIPKKAAKGLSQIKQCLDSHLLK